MLPIILAKAGSHTDAIETKIKWVLELMDIGTKGYFVLFGLLFSCGLGVPIPEDIPLLVAGALIGSRHMHLLPACVLAWCGIIGGDCILYYLGHHFGLNITKVPLVGKHVTKARILRAKNLFDRYGIWVVAVGRLFAGIRGAMVVAAGTIRFNVLKFIIADGLAALVSGGLFIYLGIKFGEHLHDVAHTIHHYFTQLLIVVALLVSGLIVWKIRVARKEKAEREAEAIAEHIGNLDPKIGEPPVQIKAD